MHRSFFISNNYFKLNMYCHNQRLPMRGKRSNLQQPNNRFDPKHEKQCRDLLLHPLVELLVQKKIQDKNHRLPHNSIKKYMMTILYVIRG
jgi:hypothetical protein